MKSILFPGKITDGVKSFLLQCFIEGSVYDDSITARFGKFLQCCTCLSNTGSQNDNGIVRAIQFPYDKAIGIFKSFVVVRNIQIKTVF